MITTKTLKEIEILSEGGKILASILDDVSSKVKAGISTKELDARAYNLIKKAGGTPSFLGYKNRDAKSAFPASLCVSINDEVVHGIPSDDGILKDGDIVGLDLGMEYKKLFTDMAVTVGVGKISEKAKNIISVAKKSLSEGINAIKEGAFLGDYGFAVQSFIEKAGFNVVRILVGHGVGYSVHEDPDIPNYGRKGEGMRFKGGMIFALEPMACDGDGGVFLDGNGWTWKTKDGLLSAHFELTVAVEKNECKILTK